jgi:hypothetical protein
MTTVFGKNSTFLGVSSAQLGNFLLAITKFLVILQRKSLKDDSNEKRIDHHRRRSADA